MLREIGFFIVLLFPIVVVYLSGGLDKPQATNSSKKKKKTKKDKNKRKAVATENDNKQTNENKQEEEHNTKEEEEVAQKAVEEAKPMTKTAIRKLKQEKKRAEKAELEAKNKLDEEAKKKQQDEKKEEEEDDEKVREIDEHMDTTAHYARVMRIQTEEEDDGWESVPYEEGWSQVKARRPAPPPSSINSSNAGSPVVGSSGFSSSSQMNSKLDRTAVKNAKKAQKRKEEKAASDALQAERLRKHQKQLEKTKINEFYSTGAGKNTPWGTKGSSKRPQATASVNEHGSLIWD